MAEPLKPRIALGIAAHPDDLDFGASGTFSQWIDEGCEAYYLILTDGSKGSADHAVTCPQLIDTRQAEQRAAAKVLGLKDVYFLGRPDGMLEVTMQLKMDIARVIRQVKPDVVVTMDPSMLYVADMGFINHPDHRAAGQATMDAVFPLARDHLSFPELYISEHLEPHKTPHLLLINMSEPNYVVDIASQYETKLTVLQAHASQVPPLDQLRSFLDKIAGRGQAKYGYEYSEQFVRIDIAG